MDEMRTAELVEIVESDGESSGPFGGRNGLFGYPAIALAVAETTGEVEPDRGAGVAEIDRVCGESVGMLTASGPFLPLLLSPVSSTSSPPPSSIESAVGAKIHKLPSSHPTAILTTSGPLRRLSLDIIPLSAISSLVIEVSLVKAAREMRLAERAVTLELVERSQRGGGSSAEVEERVYSVEGGREGNRVDVVSDRA
jgi:hypothetical protein